MKAVAGVVEAEQAGNDDDVIDSDRTGTSERVTGRRFLPDGVASVPR
mgnify:CR=1 FL=1